MKKQASIMGFEFDWEKVKERFESRRQALREVRDDMIDKGFSLRIGAVNEQEIKSNRAIDEDALQEALVELALQWEQAGYLRPKEEEAAPKLKWRPLTDALAEAEKTLRKVNADFAGALVEKMANEEHEAYRKSMERNFGFHLDVLFRANEGTSKRLDRIEESLAKLEEECEDIEELLDSKGRLKEER